MKKLLIFSAFLTCFIGLKAMEGQKPGQLTSYYQILGVHKESNLDLINRQFRSLSRQYHPDKNPDNQAFAEAKFKEINEAYEVLSDGNKKSIYDTYGYDGLQRYIEQQNRQRSQKNEIEIKQVSFQKNFKEALIRGEKIDVVLSAYDCAARYYFEQIQTCGDAYVKNDLKNTLFENCQGLFDYLNDIKGELQKVEKPKVIDRINQLKSNVEFNSTHKDVFTSLLNNYHELLKQESNKRPYVDTQQPNSPQTNPQQPRKRVKRFQECKNDEPENTFKRDIFLEKNIRISQVMGDILNTNYLEWVNIIQNEYKDIQELLDGIDDPHYYRAKVDSIYGLLKSAVGRFCDRNLKVTPEKLKACNFLCNFALSLNLKGDYSYYISFFQDTKSRVEAQYKREQAKKEQVKRAEYLRNLEFLQQIKVKLENVRQVSDLVEIKKDIVTLLDHIEKCRSFDPQVFDLISAAAIRLSQEGYFSFALECLAMPSVMAHDDSSREKYSKIHLLRESIRSKQFIRMKAIFEDYKNNFLKTSPIDLKKALLDNHKQFIQFFNNTNNVKLQGFKEFYTEFIRFYESFANELVKYSLKDALEIVQLGLKTFRMTEKRQAAYVRLKFKIEMSMEKASQQPGTNDALLEKNMRIMGCVSSFLLSDMSSPLTLEKYIKNEYKDIKALLGEIKDPVRYKFEVNRIYNVLKASVTAFDDCFANGDSILKLQQLLVSAALCDFALKLKLNSDDISLSFFEDRYARIKNVSVVDHYTRHSDSIKKIAAKLSKATQKPELLKIQKETMSAFKRMDQSHGSDGAGLQLIITLANRLYQAGYFTLALESLDVLRGVRWNNSPLEKVNTITALQGTIFEEEFRKLKECYTSFKDRFTKISPLVLKQELLNNHQRFVLFFERGKQVHDSKVSEFYMSVLDFYYSLANTLSRESSNDALEVVELAIKSFSSSMGSEVKEKFDVLKLQIDLFKSATSEESKNSDDVINNLSFL